MVLFSITGVVECCTLGLMFRRVSSTDLRRIARKDKPGFKVIKGAPVWARRIRLLSRRKHPYLGKASLSEDLLVSGYLQVPVRLYEYNKPGTTYNIRNYGESRKSFNPRESAIIKSGSRHVQVHMIVRDARASNNFKWMDFWDNIHLGNRVRKPGQRDFLDLIERIRRDGTLPSLYNRVR